MSALLFAKIGSLDNAREAYSGATRRSSLVRLTHEREQADRFRRREESHDHRAEGPDPIRIRVIMEPTSA
jgi:hypothetical protein